MLRLGLSGRLCSDQPFQRSSRSGPSVQSVCWGPGGRFFWASMRCGFCEDPAGSRPIWPVTVLPGTPGPPGSRPPRKLLSSTELTSGQPSGRAGVIKKRQSWGRAWAVVFRQEGDYQGLCCLPTGELDPENRLCRSPGRPPSGSACSPSSWREASWGRSA